MKETRVTANLYFDGEFTEAEIFEILSSISAKTGFEFYIIETEITNTGEEEQ